ncbi:MAG: hypothetical protein RL701_1711, partial [Pseudomonadota bacterium]
YPGCAKDYMIDSGIRSPTAPEGGLISLNSNNCTNPPCDIYELNAQIQKTLLNTRTFGGTPIASALDDLYQHFKGELGDNLASCRQRYAILITDGYPDDDFRLFPARGCDCVARNDCNPPGATPVYSEEDMKLYTCPYPEAWKAARDLVNGRTTPTSTDDPMLQQLFVVGMSIADTDSKNRLNEVATQGGSIDTDGDGNTAFFADDPTKLTATLDTLLSGLTRPISRSVPAFATGKTGVQYQLSAGFKLSSVPPPAGYSTTWAGILERRVFQCDAKGELKSPDLTDADKFEVQLNKQTDRSLWTATPAAPTAAKLRGAMARASGQLCGTDGCKRAELSGLTFDLFGQTDDAGKKRVVDWMYGINGSLRTTQKFGDIYHSSPVIVGAPTEDPGDPSYSLFRESDQITDRPIITYVNTNDGILHAFSLEAYTAKGTTYNGWSLRAGEELWGFVPPILVPSLEGQLSAHKLNLDGTPVVKDVFFSKKTAPKASDYHTVLITGMRSGGSAYIALDVTDPKDPKFMWQFTDPDMGLTYGQAEIVQATYALPSESPALHAMAILPGGKGKAGGSGPGCTTQAYRVPGSDGTSYTTSSDPDLTSADRMRHRTEVQCWEKAGRALYFVDVETGTLIKKIFDTDNNPDNGIVFPSPITGSPTAYQDSVGTVAVEGFVLDADGVLWRIDISDKDPQPDVQDKGWTVRPFHDLFWDRGPKDGETSYERPILSLDSSHRLVILVGTGDTDNFEKEKVRNRVVSMTELTSTLTPTLPSDYSAALNWEQVVDGGNGFVETELVTGTMSLFQGQLYLASFIAVSDVANACERGKGRLWSFDFRERNKDDQNPTDGRPGAVKTFGPKWLPVVYDDKTGTVTDNTDTGLFNITVAQAESNLLVQGLGATQRMTCEAADDPLNNYYAPASRSIHQSGAAPAIWLVAQASSSNRGRTRAGSQLGTLQVRVNRNQQFSQMSSWAGSIE